MTGAAGSPEQATLQRMLAGEHAAVYAYGVIGGRLQPGTPLQAAASTAYVEHRTRRDDLVAMVRSRGADPVVAEAGYALPAPVDTPSQARRVARVVEDRCSVLYADVVANSTGPTRAYAIDALIDAATRALSWGRGAGAAAWGAPTVRFATPPAFAADLAGREGAPGSRWLGALPGLVTALCDEWHLRPDGSVRFGYVAVVLPVRRRDDTAAALKVTYPGPDQAPEAATLQAWHGDGAVRLLAADSARWALLLERLDPTRDLCPVALDQAISVIGGLLTRLHGVEPPGDVPHLADTALRWVQEMPQLWAQARPAWPRSVLDEVVTTCRDAAHSTAVNALLHVDLHFANVLAAEREPWLAIDPKGLCGDPAFESVAVLWNRVEEYDGDTGAVARRLHAWCEAAHVDRERARAWARARIVEDALDRLTGAYGAAERDIGVHELLIAGLER